MHRAPTIHGWESNPDGNRDREKGPFLDGKDVRWEHKQLDKLILKQEFTDRPAKAEAIRY